MTAGLMFCFIMQVHPALAQMQQERLPDSGFQSASGLVAHHSSAQQLAAPARTAGGTLRSPASHGLARSAAATRTSPALDFINNAAAWLLTEQQPGGGFPWTAGSTSVFTNTQAPTAYGLIQAFRRTGNPAYIAAATAAGDYLLANPNNFPATSIKRFTGADTLFLVELTRATGDQQYRNLVVSDFWNRLQAGTYGPDNNWDAADFVAAEFVRRASIPEVVAWDLSWGVVAAHIEGRTQIAQAFIDGILQSLESVPQAGADNDLVGLSGAVWAAARVGAELDPATGKWAAADNTMELANLLLGFQQASGGVLFNSSADPLDASNQDSQVTAFTLLALDLLDRDGFAAQIASAGQYLIDQQQANGQILPYPTAAADDTGGVEVHGESMVAWAAAQMRPGLIESVAQTGDTPTATDNDYTRINNAVQMALDDDVIVLSGTFDWVEPNAFASWADGSDATAETGDDFSITYPAGRDSITMTASSQGDAVIVGPGDLAGEDLEAFLVVFSAENRNLEFSNLQIEGFDLSLGIFFAGSTVNAYDNTRIINNHIIMPTDIAGSTVAGEAFQNIGIHFSFGDNQLIAGNIIDIPGDGSSTASTTSSNVAMQSNTSSGAYEGLVIEDNLVRVLNAPAANPQSILGIWENSNAVERNIIVRNNRFINLDPANDPLNNLQAGYRITAQSSATSDDGSVWSGNQISGANVGYEWLPGRFGADWSARGPLAFIGNSAIDNAVGVRLDSNGSGDFKCNIISGNTIAGIENINADQAVPSDASVNWWGCNDGPGAGSCDQISGATVDGGNWLLFALQADPVSIGVGDSSTLSASLQNTVNGDNAAALAGCTVPDVLDVDFAGGAFGSAAPASDMLTAGLAGSVFTGNNQGIANDITATVNNGQTATTTVLIDTPIGGATVFVDDDFASNSFGDEVSFEHNALSGPVTANVGVDAFATLAEALAVSAVNAEVFVATGDYAPVSLSQPVQLIGENADAMSCTTRVAETQINNPAGAAITIAAADVSINGFALNAVAGVDNSGGFAPLAVSNNLIAAQQAGVLVQNATVATGTSISLADNCITLSGQSFAGQPSAGIFVDSINGNGALLLQNNVLADGFFGVLAHAVNTVSRPVVEAGSITGSMQGIAVVNTLDGVDFSASALDIRDLSISDFSGSGSFQAGIYAFTGSDSSATDSIDLVIDNVAIDGVQNLTTNSAGISLSDFSVGLTGPLQTAAISNVTLSNNNPRGVHAAGRVVATIDNSTFTANGSEGTGFSVVALRPTTIGDGSADVTITNSLITLPASSAGSSTALSTRDGGTISATDNQILDNGNPSGFGAATSGGASSGGVIAATCNWWGDASGPSGAGNGDGARVNGNVVFEPWNTSPAGPCDGALELSFTPSAVNFAGVLINTTATRNLIVQNVGEAPLALGALQLLDDVDGVFSIIADSCSGVTLTPGAQCQLQLQFAPLVAGSFSATLEVPSDLEASPTLIAVTGIGSAPVITADPAALTFPATALNDTASATVNLSNTGAGGLNITGLALTGSNPDPFSISFEGCIGTTLLAGESCTVNLDFAPLTAQTFEAVLSVQSNASNGELNVMLSGTGLDNEADLELILMPLNDFAAVGESFTYLLMVSNLGPLTVSAADVTSSVDAALSDLEWTCQADAGASCPASGSGDIDVAVDLASGTTVLFSITGTVTANASETLTSSALVVSPASPVDPDPANNSDETTTQSGVFADGFENPVELR
ncbi:MAG: choice-of-anchor D domain-containing protein [Gammaproteobacteria bacterium]|nr:choice-of-anchor D domain-containing protein [Gammaproteobacteria bacterium]